VYYLSCTPTCLYLRHAPFFFFSSPSSSSEKAYGLDPSRRSNGYGGEVIDTLVEKLDRSAGSDMCVILAGYEPQMRELFKNANNAGFASRFNIDESLEFEDLSDEDLRQVLLARIRREGLRASIQTVHTAVKLIAQRRRLDGFSNASEVEMILNRAKVKLATRKQAAADSKMRELSQQSPSPSKILSGRGGSLSRLNTPLESTPTSISHLTGASMIAIDPYELIESDFVSAETSAEKAREAFADLENVEHVLSLLQELEDTMNQAKSEGKSVADILDDAHMIFTGPPGTGQKHLTHISPNSPIDRFN
jgi:hypothetical protein